MELLTACGYADDDGIRLGLRAGGAVFMTVVRFDPALAVPPVFADRFAEARRSAALATRHPDMHATTSSFVATTAYGGRASFAWN